MELNQLQDEILQQEMNQKQQIEEGYQNIQSHEDVPSEQIQEELLDKHDQVELEEYLIDEAEVGQMEESGIVADYDLMQRQQKELTIEIQKLKENESFLRTSISDKELSYAHILNDVKSGQNNLRDLEQQNQELQIQKVLLKKQIENQRVSFESKNGEFDNLNFVVAGLQNQRDNLIEEIARYTSQKDQIDEKLTKRKENLFELVQQQSEIQSQCDELYQTLSSLRREQNTAKQESEKLQAKIEQLKEEFIELDGIQRIKSNNRIDTEEKIKLLENQFQSEKLKIEKDLKELSQTKENMEREVEALKSKIQEQQNDIIVARINLNTKKQERIEIETENLKIKEMFLKQLQGFEASINILKDTDSDLKGQCDLIENQIQSIRQYEVTKSYLHYRENQLPQKIEQCLNSDQEQKQEGINEDYLSIEYANIIKQFSERSSQ
ncbi:hypothetical protein FGO68_gene15345 [Halteria grandinella]|uniref:Uncharacterized protein n=1 Tax=Halteria grandinella TaxID=5974 RepID=A0A8J8T6R1_HALGN|nr:hypothetical protein FGO68_gene15345 [Halteria grandinella]